MTQYDKPKYRDANASISQRVFDLLSRMTLEEKTAQLRSMWFGKHLIYDNEENFSVEKALNVIPDGIGQIARPSDIRGRAKWDIAPFRSVEKAVAFVNAVQRFMMESTRLGIPVLFHEELAHGLLAGEATIFPIPPGLASTWDPELVEEAFAVAAFEARMRGAHIALTPVVDLLRDPRYGRAEEFFGEDPHLVAQMGLAAVRGMQGRTRPLGPERVFCTLKHFVHGSPSGGLNIAPAEVSERALWSSFLVPFGEIIRKGDPAVIMPSYNEILGVPSHASIELLQDIGRGKLGFRGVYISDYEGVGNLKNQHHVAATLDDAVSLALSAGVAADLPEGESYANIPALVRAGRISENEVDAAVASILALKFEIGLFENPYVDPERAVRETNKPIHVAVARTVAERAIILLKNDGVLPLVAKAGMRLAVVGPGSVEPLLGGYSGSNSRSVGILEGIRRAAPKEIIIEQADGVWITSPDANGAHRSYSPIDTPPASDNFARIAEAVELVRRSDVVLLVVGDVPAITREAVAVELPGDRSTLDLWGMQDDLIDALAATGKPIVALLLNGRPLAVNRLVEKVNGLFEGWYLGQEGGNAFADVLFGRANPGGKLTVSFPKSVGELPVYYNRQPTLDVNRYLEGRGVPLFPFGHGLSYTTFEISEPRLSKVQIGPDEGVDVEVDVTNTGARTGDEVVQLYLRDEVSSVPRPILELRGFQRVTLVAGETRTVVFHLEPDALALWDIHKRWRVEPGAFTISVGNSSISLKPTKLTVVAANT